MLIAAGIRAGVKGYKAHEAKKKEKERKEEEEKQKLNNHLNAPPAYTTHPSNQPHSHTAYRDGFGPSHTSDQPNERRRSIRSDSDSGSSVSSVNDDDRARFPSLSEDELKELKKQEKLARKQFMQANKVHGQGHGHDQGHSHGHGHTTGTSGRGGRGGRAGSGGRGGGGDGAKVWGKVLKGVMLG